MPPLLATGLDATTLVIGLSGGLAIFLFGMGQMTDALKKAAGAGLRGILKRLTANRFFAVLTGALVTAVVQSSSVTTVLVVGFVSAGIMTLAQSVGVIFGANIGTTITAQIVAFDVAAYALAIIAIGFALMSIGRTARVKNLGAALMGLGMIFFGMGLMGEATAPLRTYQPFIDVMQSMHNPLLAMAVAAIFTALVQSSSATTGIVIVLAAQGFISLEAGIALALGSNVGTCVTAALASIGKPVAARQAAAVHVIFNLGGALLWASFIGGLAALVRDVSPSHPELEGAARAAAEVPRQIANAHTFFNVANTILFLPFTGLLARLVERLIQPKEEVDAARKPKFLDPQAQSVPSLAAERMRLEIARMGDRILEGLRSMHLEGGPALDPSGFLEAASDAESLYASILEYGRRVSVDQAGRRTDDELANLRLAANHLMSITDSLRRKLLDLAKEGEHGPFDPTPVTRRRLRELTEAVLETLETSVRALEQADGARAAHAMELGGHVKVLAGDLHAHLEQRLADRTTPTTVRRYRTEFALVEALARIEYFAQRIAETVAHTSAPPAEAAEPPAAATTEPDAT